MLSRISVYSGTVFNGEHETDRGYLLFLGEYQIRGTFGKFLAWSFISVTDLQILSCLVSF